MSTIAAIATATGTGSVGIIRMSGKDCFKVLEKIFIPKNKNISIDEIPGYTIKYGHIIDPNTGMPMHGKPKNPNTFNPNRKKVRHKKKKKK